ncbi:MAG: short-chain dehydrogenase [Hyphomicrobiales bacterium]|mgnify:CR=1 FL=1|nr:MAG: short-chain dehydrogenase [Hyphomicrobiales bacterium]
MSDKSILITGCSSGIGEAAALDLAARGWRVFATARKAEDIARLDAVDGIEALYLDYTDQASIEAVAATVLERTNGKLYALFNNGAYGQPGAVEDLPTDALRVQFETNLFGWHELTRRLIPAMRANGRGRIIQCSSVLGFVAMKYRGAYNASKFALEGLTDTLRQELYGTGIAVVSIEPGPIATKFGQNAVAAFRRNIVIEGSPHQKVYEESLGRFRGRSAGVFTLQSSAVVAKLRHALMSSRPKPYYCVTFPTYLMGALKRILPNRLMQRFLAAVSNANT